MITTFMFCAIVSVAAGRALLAVTSKSAPMGLYEALLLSVGGGVGSIWLGWWAIPTTLAIYGLAILADLAVDKANRNAITKAEPDQPEPETAEDFCEEAVPPLHLMVLIISAGGGGRMANECEEILSGAGHTCMRANSAQAIEFLLHSGDHFDFALFDAGLLTAEPLAAEVLDMALGVVARVVLVGEDEGGLREASGEREVLGFITRPIDGEELLAMAESVV